MNRVGIIGAMDKELRTLKNAAAVKRTVTRAGTEFCEGILGGTEVVIVKCGIGKINAAVCTQILIDTFDVTAVINTGVAGSLSETLKIGDLVISEDAAQHDFDIVSLGFQKGEIPYTGLTAFPALRGRQPGMCRLWKAESAPVISSFLPDLRRQRLFQTLAGCAVRWKAVRSLRCAGSTKCRLSLSGRFPTRQTKTAAFPSKLLWKLQQSTARQSCRRWCQWQLVRDDSKNLA